MLEAEAQSEFLAYAWIIYFQLHRTTFIRQPTVSNDSWDRLKKISKVQNDSNIKLELE
jgi:hypothetical protein